MKTNEEKSKWFGLGAGTLSVIAFLLYNWKNFTDETHPNISSWAIWSFIAVLNFTSYKEMTGDRWKSLLPSVNSGMCLITFLLAMYTGSFKSLNASEIWCLTLGVTAGLCWCILKSATFAQLFIQAAMAIGFIPTLVGVLQHPGSEPWSAWLLWLAGSVFHFFSVKYTWRGNRVDFIYPISMFFFHGATLVLALR